MNTVGVCTPDDDLKVRALGVARVGATATEAILTEALRRKLPAPFPGDLKRLFTANVPDLPTGY